jgi:hypothetical protein
VCRAARAWSARAQPPVVDSARAQATSRQHGAAVATVRGQVPLIVHIDRGRINILMPGSLRPLGGGHVGKRTGEPVWVCRSVSGIPDRASCSS